MSIGFFIDRAYGVKLVVHQKPIEFLNKIIIQERKVAIWDAKNNISYLALWLDGSKVELVGIKTTVIWKNPTFYRWKVYKTTLEKNK